MKISVVTISYNQAHYLERCLDSVLSQDGVELEYIVVDAYSSDGSREILERYRDRLSTLIVEKDNGPPDGLNKGFSHATGDIFYYLNSDSRRFAMVAMMIVNLPVSIVLIYGIGAA